MGCFGIEVHCTAFVENHFLVPVHGVVIRDTIAGRPAIRLRGIVSLENKGGFVQVSLRSDTKLRRIR